MVGCALAFTDASLHLGSREEVLVVAQPLAAGQVLTTGDLRAVRVSTGSGLDVVLVGEEASVVGRRAAVPLVAGALLTSSEVGNAPPVGSGSDVVAVGLKAGAYPPDLAPGDRVQVVPVTSSSSAGAAGTSRAGARCGRRCWRSSRRRLTRTTRRCSLSRSPPPTRTRWRRWRRRARPA